MTRRQVDDEGHVVVFIDIIFHPPRHRRPVAASRWQPGGMEKGRSDTAFRILLRSTGRGLETWHGICLNRRASPRPTWRLRTGGVPYRDAIS